jgi:hypothetical protein
VCSIWHMLKACMWRYDHSQNKIVQVVLVLKSNCFSPTCVVVVYASVSSSCTLPMA